MSKITTLLVIFTCLTTAFALNATLTKNFFFVSTYNSLSYKLFHTTNGIIAYNIEYSESGPIPEYLLLDPIQSSATLILQDILSSCAQIGGPGGVFDRLQYHVQTSTLAYFCTANNSLLILDEKTYAVQDAISTGISGSFSEAKLTADGSSLYVLLTGTLFLENQVPSQLVQIDLSSRKVVRSVVFNQGLEVNEYVNGFVSQNNEAFALTNTINSTSGVTRITIYSVSSAYELVKLTNFTNEGNSHFLSQLYQIGDYLVTNNLDNLIFLDKQGNKVSSHGMINSKDSYTKTVSKVPAMVAQEGSSDLYVLFTNQNPLIKYTAENGAIVNGTINSVFDFQIAYGNHYTNDLLFTIDYYMSNFTIATLQNFDLIYSVPSSYNDFMITNNTFGVNQNGLLQVFDRKTNAFIGNVSLHSSFYLHKGTDSLYYTEESNSYKSCVIKRLDLTTLSSVDIQKYNDFNLCIDSISQFNISDAGIPEFVALDQVDNKFTVVTQSHGIVHFDNVQFSSDTEYIVADFETMSLYRLQADSNGNSAAVFYYEYNGTGFTLKNTYELGGAPISSFYANESGNAYAFSEGSFRIVDLESGSATEYSCPTDVHIVSSFEDNEGKEHLIFSDCRFGGSTWFGNVTQPSLFDYNGVSQLPGTNEFTVQAGAAGQCAYWVVDGLISSVGVVKFYDACAQDTQEEIILQ